MRKTLSPGSNFHKPSITFSTYHFVFFHLDTIRKQTSFSLAATAAKSLQSCPILCDPIDSSPPGSPIPGILQAKILEWAAISSFNAWKWKVKVKLLSRVRLLATPWTAAYQAPPSMEFSRQEYWSGVPLPSPFFSLNNMQFHSLYFLYWKHISCFPYKFFYSYFYYWQMCNRENKVLFDL